MFSVLQVPIRWLSWIAMFWEKRTPISHSLKYSMRVWWATVTSNVPLKNPGSAPGRKGLYQTNEWRLNVFLRNFKQEVPFLQHRNWIPATFESGGKTMCHDNITTVTKEMDKSRIKARRRRNRIFLFEVKTDCYFQVPTNRAVSA